MAVKQRRGRLILMPGAQDVYAGQIKGLKAIINRLTDMVAEREGWNFALTNERDALAARVRELEAEQPPAGTGEQPSGE